MMNGTLMRSQSLKSLSGDQRSWGTSEFTVWQGRKSVSQLVEQYQSCLDLRNADTKENRSKGITEKDGTQWRGNLPTLRGGSSLSRSRSMEVLPQREPTGAVSLRALFESKKTLQQDFTSTPHLHTSPAVKWPPVTHNSLLSVRDPSSGRTSGHSGEVTPAKRDVLQESHRDREKSAQPERRETISGRPSGLITDVGGPSDVRRQAQLTLRESSFDRGREKIFLSNTLPTIKDRSALYLSKVAAADSPKAATQEEHTSGNKTKQSKFLSPVKEMCSACLTPVYPMEKMVAGKLILHKICFCCKHCKQKLSIHNYSSVYGEFYCMSHYQQLFKSKGNYDEGFGHKQHKDRWLIKREEPTSEVKKNHVMLQHEVVCVDNPIRPSAGVLGAPQRSRDMVLSIPDVRNKRKFNWPPEKKGTAQSPSSLVNSMTNQQNRPVKKFVENSLQSEVYTQNTSSNHNGIQVTPDETPGPIPASPEKSQFMTPSYYDTVDAPEHSETSIKHDSTKKTAEKALPTEPASVTDNVAEAGLKELGTVHSGKKKKTVRFAPGFDTEQEQEHLQGLHSDGDNKNNVSSLDRENPDDGLNMVINPITNTVQAEEGTANSNIYHSSAKESNGELEATAITTPNVTSPDQEIPGFNDTGVVKGEKTAQHSETKTEQWASEDLTMKGEIELEQGTDTDIEHHVGNKQSDSGLRVKEGSDDQPKTDEKSNDKAISKQDKPSTQRGSWSKGKGPLSKLFTSNTKEKVNKSEPQEIKRPEAKPKNLLSKLFQTSDKGPDLKNLNVPGVETETTEVKDVKPAPVKENGDASTYLTVDAINESIDSDDTQHSLQTSETLHEPQKENERSDSDNYSDVAVTSSASVTNAVESDPPISPGEVFISQTHSDSEDLQIHLETGNETNEAGILPGDSSNMFNYQTLSQGHASDLFTDSCMSLEAGKIGFGDILMSEMPLANTSEEMGEGENEAEFGAPTIQTDRKDNMLDDILQNDPFGMSDIYTAEQLDVFGLSNTPAASVPSNTQENNVFDFMMGSNVNQCQNPPLQGTDIAALPKDEFDLFSSPPSHTFPPEGPDSDTSLLVDQTQVISNPFDNASGIDNATPLPPAKPARLFSDDLFSSVHPGPPVADSSSQSMDGFLDPLATGRVENKENSTANTDWMDDLLS